MEKMDMNIKESMLIRPVRETPKHRIRTTVLDRVMPLEFSRFLCFYKPPPPPPCGDYEERSSIFFESRAMKEGLSKVLVPFYPFAGRLIEDGDGEFDIQCNGEGVLFVDAETSCRMDDFPRAESSLKLMQLLPSFDYTKDESFSHPIFMVQITRFKCGGVCVGGMIHHRLGDGTSSLLFINSWAEMTRGNPVISVLPVLDRSILDIGVPSSPSFPHREYGPPPRMNNDNNPTTGPVSSAIIEVSPDRMRALRQIYSTTGDGSLSPTEYSRFAVLAAHIWRCTCKARALPPDQLSQFEIATDGRFKMKPDIPLGYIGKVVFSTAPRASSGVIQTEPLNDSVERIQGTLRRMDDVYLKSALAHLKQQLPDLSVARRGIHHCASPNLMISNMSNMPAYLADFGWGPPLLFRPVLPEIDGVVYILPSPTAKDGSLMMIVDLETDHLRLFKKFFYEPSPSPSPSQPHPQDIKMRSRY